MRTPIKVSWLGVALATTASLVAAESPGARWWRIVSELASDRYQGRAATSEGYRQAAAFLVTEFSRLGLKPAGEAGFIQSVPFQARQIREAESSLVLMRKGIQEVLHLGTDAYFGLGIDPPPVVEAPLVFAGYGLSIPEAGYDDLAGLDLRDKIVVTIRGGPSSIPGPLRAHAQSSRERLPALVRAGAIGLVTILDPKSMDLPWERISALRLEPSLVLRDPAMQDGAGLKLSLTVNPERAEKWFEGSGHTAAELLQQAAKGERLPRFPLTWTLRAIVSTTRWETECWNVAALLEGRDPKLRREYVVVSAHLDHLGMGAPVGGDSVYNGAMDNASGVASLVEIARILKSSPPRRSVLFLAVTGEERGLLGSRYFAARPTVDRSAIVANINLDMYLPIHPLRALAVYGLEESTLGDVARRVAPAMGVRVQGDLEPQRNLFIRSDQYSFIRAGVPALSFKFGYERGSREESLQKNWLRERYHAVSDDANQHVDLAAAVRFNRVIAEIVRVIANQPQRPRWKQDSFFRRYAQSE